MKRTCRHARTQRRARRSHLQDALTGTLLVVVFAPELLRDALHVLEDVLLPPVEKKP